MTADTTCPECGGRNCAAGLDRLQGGAVRRNDKVVCLDCGHEWTVKKLRTEEEIRAVFDKISSCSFGVGCSPYICSNCEIEELCKSGEKALGWALRISE